MRRLSRSLPAVVLLALASAPASAQTDAWKNQWYWGAQAGAFVYKTATSDFRRAFSYGGHWFITANRVGLLLSFDQLSFRTGTTSAISDFSGVRTVAFTAGRVIGGELVAMPTIGDLILMGGFGVNITQITNAVAGGSFSSSAEEALVAQLVEDAASKALMQISAGVQYNYQRWGVFAKYTLLTQGRDFLITSEQHSLSGGIRYAITASSEAVDTAR